MEINDALVNRLADLARLEFDGDQKNVLKKDLEKIFQMVEKLREVNVDGVEPLIYMNEEANVLRKDVVSGTVSKTDALLNAPQKDSDYFKVPKVLKK